MRRLNVFREIAGAFQTVGSLTTSQAERGGSFETATFSYDAAYRADPASMPVSAALPLQAEPSTPAAARAFFEGLLPEGSVRKLFADALHGDAAAYPRLLSRLNNESVGALVFSERDSIDIAERGYEPLSFDALERFAGTPDPVAFDLSETSRLSLAGAQTKIGLYHHDDDPCQGWFLPRGTAASTHIVKAAPPNGPFPNQTVNEAFCLLAARHCGFETAHCELIPVAGHDPLLAIERFDRTVPRNPQLVDGLPLPWRLHQEDLCQALGFPAYAKYEPTDRHYLSLASAVLSQTSSNPFGDRMMFFESVLFDYLAGNCDNHLKNHSLLWNPAWSQCELAPLYDLTCTTLYPSIDREMGIALCPSRRIDDVTLTDIETAGASVGLTPDIARRHYANLRREFFEALDRAEGELADQGYTAVHAIAQFVRDDARARTPQA